MARKALLPICFSLESPVLTPGNTKLGPGRLIWGFGLPSRATCPGMTAACSGPWKRQANIDVGDHFIL